MNRKAAVQGVWLILVLIAGLFVADQAGIFSVFTPSTPDQPVLGGVVNKWYYDPAVTGGTTWTCAAQVTVVFRATFLVSSTSLPNSSSNIAVDEGGVTLRRPLRAGSSQSGISNCDTQGTLQLTLPSGAGVYRRTDGFYNLCLAGAWTREYTLTAVTNPVETTKSVVDPTREVSQSTPILDWKYTCENNNVVQKYCLWNSNPAQSSNTVDTCAASLPCQFLLGQTVPEGSRDIVKCSGTYKPSLNICSSDATSLYTTSATGSLSSILCGINGYNVCSGGQCALCKESTSWCVGNTPTSCTNGQPVSGTTCPGITTCTTTGTSPDTNAICQSQFTNGEERCNLATQTAEVYDSSIGNFKNKYAFGACRTSCTEDATTASCSNQCVAGTNYCEVGTFYKCDVNPAGNQKVYYNTPSDSQCLSGTCKDANTCQSQYTLNDEYCGGTNGKQRQKGIADVSGNPLTGGVIKQDLPVAACNIACLTTTGTPQTTSCQQLQQCIGNIGSNVCVDTDVGTCNSVGDAFTSTQDCQATSTQGFCNDPPSGPAFCDVTPQECTGAYACSNNKVYACVGGYFDLNTVVDACNNLGCSLTNANLPSPSNSQCTNDAQCSSAIIDAVCSGSNSIDCTTRAASDKDNVQYIQGSSTSCVAGCNAASGLCLNQCSGSYGCYNNKIYACSNGAFNFNTIVDSCNTLGCSLTDTNLPSPSNSQCTNDAQCSSPTINAVCTASTASTQCTIATVTDKDNAQYIKGATTNCGAEGCDDQTGLCTQQCTPGLNICTSGKIRSCDANGNIGSITPTGDCGELGCNTATNTCNNGCSVLDAYSCNADQITSQYCTLNTTTQQKYFQKTACGAEGCDVSTGRCKSGTPFSFTCRPPPNGQDLYQRDASGFLPSTFFKRCSLEPLKDGLQPYCSEGKSDCVVCQPQAYLCKNNQKVQCTDPIQGTFTTLESCEAGCISEGINIYCDQLQFLLTSQTVYSPTQELIIAGYAKGSVSQRGVTTTYTATLKDVTGSVVETKTGTTNAAGNNDGTFTFSFGIKPLGAYTATINLPSYPSQNRNFTMHVTNSYQTLLIDTSTKNILPGQKATFKITSLDTNGNAPDSLKITRTPANTTVEVINTAVLGTYNLQVGGSTGSKSIGVTATKGGIDLEEQTISVEIRNPTLDVQTTIPTSISPATKTYDITIMSSGQPIQPDSITMTITGATTTTVNLASLGSGKYTFAQDFNTLGTYTINIQATKAGYESLAKSALLQVTSDGNPVTPSPPVCTNGVRQSCYVGTCLGTQVCTSGAWSVCTKLNASCDGGAGVPVPTPIDSKTLLIIAAIIGAAIYFRKGGRKR